MFRREGTGRSKPRPVLVWHTAPPYSNSQRQSGRWVRGRRRERAVPWPPSFFAMTLQTRRQELPSEGKQEEECREAAKARPHRLAATSAASQRLTSDLSTAAAAESWARLKFSTWSARARRAAKLSGGPPASRRQGIPYADPKRPEIQVNSCGNIGPTTAPCNRMQRKGRRKRAPHGAASALLQLRQTYSEGKRRRVRPRAT